MKQSRRKELPAESLNLSGFESFGKKKEKTGFYVKLARKAGKMFQAKNEYKNDKVKLSVDFMGWKLQPKEVNAAPNLALAVSLMVCIPLILIAFFMLSFNLFLYAALALLILPFMFMMWIQNYPVSSANSERMKAITFIPEIINYLVMSMKLSPNLENAVKFAAEHGRGKISEDMQRIVWEVDLGKFSTIEEALDDLAYKWGPFSDEFKHGLMLVRSSVIEIDESKRNLLLDKAVTDTLEGISESMGKYANEMKQPSVYLYYVGVLLPLLLIIMLPIGSAMAGLALSDVKFLVLLYNILIPLGTFFFARNILSKRPPVYIPPQIPDNYPGLPKKGHIKIGKTEMPTILLAMIVFIAIYLASAYALEPLLNPYPEFWDTTGRENYMPFFQIFGVFLGLGVAISVYLTGMVSAKRKEQLRIMKMETEFKDSVYILASRLGENRPLEEAITYSAQFLKGNEVSKLFDKTSQNIRNLGMTAESAFFDPTYGSLRYVPSDLINGSVRIVIDSINLGVQQAARALISLSLQLRDSEKIQAKIKSMLEEITSMMKSIAFMIAPLVLGITTALQRIIVTALESACGQSQQFGGSGFSGSSMPVSICKNPETLASMPSPMVFMFIMALYVLQVTVILIYFTSKIEEGNNRLSFFINLAISLPMALVFFFASAWMASQISAVIG